jgi:phage-related protein
MLDSIMMVLTDSVVRELAALPAGQRNRVLARIRHVEQMGWTTAVRGGDLIPLRSRVWELRVLGTGPAFRILFVPTTTDMERRLVLTTCVSKAELKKRAVMDAHVRRALRRFEQWLVEQGV